MDKIKNPFSPGAGSPPPALTGRESILEQAAVLLGRIRERRSEKSILMTGLRGVGKTVLLNEMERMAVRGDYSTILMEAHENKPLALLLIPRLRRLLFDLDRIAGAGDRVRRGVAVLKSFISTVRDSVGDVAFGIDIDAEQGSADSGDIEVDLPNLLTAVAEAAEERRTSVAILIDEIQFLRLPELSALIMAMHTMQQRQLPLLLIGAGLPIMTRLAGESKSYAERLFSFPVIGPLPESDAGRAITKPIESAGEEIEGAAVEEIARLTRGYPYFLQEWGYQAWNHAASSPITLQTVLSATAHVKKRLDENFFRVRFNRLTPREERFLRAMAQLGAGPHRTAKIAEVLGIRISSIGPVRANLIKKGMIFSPAHGEMAFTVPLFDEFMRRTVPDCP